MHKLGAIKNYLQFVLSLVCILSLLLVSWYLDVDVSGSIVATLGLYIGGRSLTFGAASMASAKDEKADTHKIVTEMNEK